jgi:hypothetical protein
MAYAMSLSEYRIFSRALASHSGQLKKNNPKGYNSKKPNPLNYRHLRISYAIKYRDC